MGFCSGEFLNVRANNEICLDFVMKIKLRDVFREMEWFIKQNLIFRSCISSITFNCENKLEEYSEDKF